MRKWYLLIDFIKSLNIFRRIKKAEIRIGELCGHTSYLQNEIQLLNWQLLHPPVFKIDQKVKTKQGIGEIVAIKAHRGFYGTSNYYTYTVSIKCTLYAFHKSDLNEYKPKKRNPQSRSSKAVGNGNKK